jgi:hypothetical protein
VRNGGTIHQHRFINVYANILVSVATLGRIQMSGSALEG